MHIVYNLIYFEYYLILALKSTYNIHTPQTDFSEEDVSQAPSVTTQKYPMVLKEA